MRAEYRKQRALGERIRKLKLDGVSWTSAVDLMDSFMRGYFSPTLKQVYPLTYRVRRHTEPGSFATRHDLWSRKLGEPGPGRFNASGEPVLYLAGDE